MRKLSDLTEEYVVKFCPTLASVTGLLGGYKVASTPASARSVALSWHCAVPWLTRLEA